MTIYKSAKSRFWQYSFQEGGARYSGSTKCENKRDAERVEAELKRNLRMGIKQKAHITLDAAAGTWFDHRGKHQRSAANTRYMLANLIAGLGKNTRIADVTWRDLAAYVARRRAKVSDSSVNREIERARALWGYTAKCGYNVGEPIEWGQLLLPEPKGRARELTGEEQARLMQALSPDLAAVALFAILTGQRKAAVVGLRWSDVDLARATATVTLKAEAHTRHSVALCPEAVALIASRPKVGPFIFTYEAKRNQPARTCAKTGQKWPQRVKGQRYPLSLQGWQREWRAALADAEIDGFRFHDLRHTTGSRVTRAAGLRVAQVLLGHTRIETTARYAHVDDGDVRAGVAAAAKAAKPEAIAEQSQEFSQERRVR